MAIVCPVHTNFYRKKKKKKKEYRACTDCTENWKNFSEYELMHRDVHECHLLLAGTSCYNYTYHLALLHFLRCFASMHDVIYYQRKWKNC